VYGLYTVEVVYDGTTTAASFCMKFVDKLYASRQNVRMKCKKGVANRETTVDVKGFVRFFGGQAAMRLLWEQQGLTLTKGTQDKWVMRGTVPTSRVMEAVMVARKRRLPFDFAVYVRTKKL
jgi:hypothetical protein